MTTFEVAIDNAKMQIHCNDSGPLSSWITFRLSDPPNSNDNDTYGMVEGQLCRLDSGILIACVLSSDSYAVSCWAVDISGAIPRVGSRYYFNSDGNSWTTPPMTDDPKLQAIGDLNECVALGNYTFGYTGEANQSYEASGDLWVYPGIGPAYGHVASLFSVNPTTLEIIRNHFVIGHWSSPQEAVGSNATVARWGNKMIIASSQGTSSVCPIWIVSEDGSLSVIHSLDTSWANGSTPVVIGDSVFVWAEAGPYGGGDYHLLEIALPGGGITDHGAYAAIGGDNYSWFGTPYGSTKAAWITVQDDGTSPGASVQIVIWDGTSLSLTNIGYEGFWVGFTGGWYSNVNDISETSDGNLLLSWMDISSRQMRWAIFDGSAIISTDQVADFYEPPYPSGYNYGFSARSEATENNGAGALWISHTYNGGGSNYGVYMSVHKSAL